MYCPHCGANNLIEQNFCRTCGLNLEETAKSLLLQIPSAESADLMRRERMLEKFGAFAWYGFEAVLFIGIGALIYAIINGLVLSGKNPLLGILFAGFIIFAMLTLIYVFLNEGVKEKKKQLKLNLQKEITKPKITNKLLEEQTIEPLSSVTEHSTELLFVENKTRKIN